MPSVSLPSISVSLKLSMCPSIFRRAASEGESGCLERQHAIAQHAEVDVAPAERQRWEDAVR